MSDSAAILPPPASLRRWSAARLLSVLGICILLWALLAVLCLCWGSTGIRWPDHADLADRLQNVLLASLVGAALSSAGVVYQAIFRNALADPYLLGVSSGATLAAYCWRFGWAIHVGIVLFGAEAALSQQAFAFAGAIISVGLVLALSSQRGRLEPLTLLLVGVIVNSINGAIFLTINTILRDPSAQSGSTIGFLVGGIHTSLTWAEKFSATLCIAAGWVVLLLVSGQLNAAVLSEGEAQSLGVRVRRLRWLALVFASLVTAAAVSISGPIGFVGLICPHLARLLVGRDARRLLPVATALGAGLLAVADSASRYLASTSVQTTLPVGILTSLLGGPFFLLLLYQSRRRQRVMEGQ